MELKALGQSGVGFSYGSGDRQAMRGLVPPPPQQRLLLLSPLQWLGGQSLKRQAMLFFAMALPLLWLLLCPGISQY